MLKLSKEQEIVLIRLATAELKAAVGNEKEKVKAEEIRKEIESWKIYRTSKELIDKDIEALKKYNLLQVAAGAFRTDCSLCIHAENCEFEELKETKGICPWYINVSIGR